MAAPNFDTGQGQHSGAFAAAVTPSDVTVFAVPTRELRVGGVGDLVVKMAGDGAVVTIPSVLAGERLPYRVTQVRAATTATLITAIW